MYGQAKKPMTKTSRHDPQRVAGQPERAVRDDAERAIANSSSGKARKTSIARAITASTQPPK